MEFILETLKNIFKLGEDAVRHIIKKELNALTRWYVIIRFTLAFALWYMTHKYREKSRLIYLAFGDALLHNNYQEMNLLPPINERTGQTIEEYLQLHGLYLEFNKELLFEAAIMMNWF
ncbi:hypothetical protein [Legionella sp. 16cNR16C]|uniref:hypothetical protein n=1 Tax=Legionella sp. 16cNR16C TaxID=2905656 RepID=UPI001E32C60F|nr:hypothetical protein [Legionella sp. 16cNR16C]MCE3045209.1 hypothetical protein [Legionella sp. 16cNR16C]